MGKGSGTTRSSSKENPKGLTVNAGLASGGLNPINFSAASMRVVSRSEYEGDNSPEAQNLKGYISDRIEYYNNGNKAEGEAYIAETWASDLHIKKEYDVYFDKASPIGHFSSLGDAIKGLTDYVNSKRKK